MPLKLNTELFIVPDKGSYLAYAPRRNYAMRLHGGQVNLLVRLKRGHLRRNDGNSDLVKALSEAGIINGTPEQQLPTAVRTSFAPTRVTLFLTNRCNLGCQYCYAGGQTADMVMPEEIGNAAIDYAAANCVSKGKKVLDLGFHGGGEVTTVWDALTAFLHHAQSVASRNRLTLRTGVATNAYMSARKAEWIARNFSNVNVSLDGPPHIQNIMRPTKGGGPTARVVMRTLRILEHHGTPYGIQATITKDTVAEMPRIVTYFSEHIKPTMVKFEPVADCGRYYGKSHQMPAGEEFARSFNQAYKVGAGTGLHVAFSGVRLFGPGLSYFCGAFGEPFSVTPDGFVSACYEAYSAEAPFAETFVFGRFDRSTKTFAINKSKLERLRKRNIYMLAACKKCFCKYGCAGDCATRNFRHTGTRDLGAVGARCEIIREIMRQRLADFVDTAEWPSVKTEEADSGFRRQAHGEQHANG